MLNARTLALSLTTAAVAGLAACEGSGAPTAAAPAGNKQITVSCATPLSATVDAASDTVDATDIARFAYQLDTDGLGMRVELLDNTGSTLGVATTRGQVRALDPFSVRFVTDFAIDGNPRAGWETTATTLRNGALMIDSTIDINGRTLREWIAAAPDLSTADVVLGTPTSEVSATPTTGTVRTIDGVEYALLDIDDAGTLIAESSINAWLAGTGLDTALASQPYRLFARTLGDRSYNDALDAQYRACTGLRLAPDDARASRAERVAVSPDKELVITPTRIAANKQESSCGVLLGDIANAHGVVSTVTGKLGVPAFGPGPTDLASSLAARAGAGGAFASVAVGSPLIGAGIAFGVPVLAGVAADALAPVLLEAALSGNPAAQNFFFGSGGGGGSAGSGNVGGGGAAPGGGGAGGGAGGGGSGGGGSGGGGSGGGGSGGGGSGGGGSGGGGSGGGGSGGGGSGGGGSGGGGSGGGGSGGGGSGGGGSGGGGSGSGGGGLGGFGGGGTSTGDPHLSTIDGLRYDFQAAGEFVLAETVGTATTPITIQVRQQSFGANPQCGDVSVNSAVAARLGGSRVTLNIGRTADRVLLVDGEVPFLVGGIKTFADGSQLVQVADNTYRLYWPDGSALEVDTFSGSLDTQFSPAAVQRGQMQGLLGRPDGDPTNDLAARDGSAFSTPVAFSTLHGAYADAWRISDAESLFDYAPGESTANFQNPAFPTRPASVDALAANVVDDARMVCTEAGVTDPGLLTDCVLDVACTGDTGFGTRHADRPAPVTTLAVTNPLDLTDGTARGGNGSWVPAADGGSVTQTADDAPGFYPLDGTYDNHVISGTLTVEPGAPDDDYIGVVFGYNSPLDGDADNAYDFYLLSWKSVTETLGGVQAQAGLSLARVDGVIDDPLPGFWGQNDSTGYTVLATDFGADRGWESGTAYAITVRYTPDRLTIGIDGETVFTLSAAQAGVANFPPGAFGFYNYSQPDVRFDNFDVRRLDAATPDDATGTGAFCTRNTDCDDGDPTTANACNFAASACISEPIPGACALDADCDDGDVTTENRCTDNRCANPPIDGACASDAACDDGDPTTADACNTDTNQCMSMPIDGACTVDADCDDGDATTADACDTGANACTFTPVEGACNVDADCDDDNATTADRCLDNFCVFPPVDGACNSDADCDDGDPTTDNLCNLATDTCFFPPAGSSCSVDADCDDGDPNTTDTCGMDNLCRNVGDGGGGGDPVTGFLGDSAGVSASVDGTRFTCMDDAVSFYSEDFTNSDTETEHPAIGFAARCGDTAGSVEWTIVFDFDNPDTPAVEATETRECGTDFLAIVVEGDALDGGTYVAQTGTPGSCRLTAPATTMTGETITGTFSGTFIDFSGSTHEITDGEFRVTVPDQPVGDGP